MTSYFNKNIAALYLEKMLKESKKMICVYRVTIRMLKLYQFNDKSNVEYVVTTYRVS